jgi:hypothetical protein
LLAAYDAARRIAADTLILRLPLTGGCFRCRQPPELRCRRCRRHAAELPPGAAIISPQFSPLLCSAMKRPER